MNELKTFQRLALPAALLLALSGCASDDNDNDTDTTGSGGGGDTSLETEVSFTKLVTLGDSLTAGYADSSLYLSAQQNSYPAILARQLGIQDFAQPEVNDDVGGLVAPNGTVVQQPRYVFDALTQSPVRDSGTVTTGIMPLGGSYQNLGVPGAKLIHAAYSGYGSVANLPDAANPYFTRMASTTEATMLGDAVAQNGTFFVLWLGNNDLLSYAADGGSGTNQTDNTDPTTYGSEDITNPSVFAQLYSTVVTQMTANGAHGVVVNLPDVTSIPYFTTVPYNVLTLTAEQAAAANAAYADYNSGVQAALAAELISEQEASKRTLSFSEGANAVVIDDENLTYLGDHELIPLPNYRQATSADLPILTTGASIATAVATSSSDIPGLTTALADDQILTVNELEALSTAQQAFNASIAAVAEANANVELLDANALMADLAANGYATGDDSSIRATFITGGAFSLDGVHPSQRGYAVIANELISLINSKYGQSFATVDPLDYPTVLEPAQ